MKLEKMPAGPGRAESLAKAGLLARCLWSCQATSPVWSKRQEVSAHLTVTETEACEGQGHGHSHSSDSPRVGLWLRVARGVSPAGRRLSVSHVPSSWPPNGYHSVWAHVLSHQPHLGRCHYPHQVDGDTKAQETLSLAQVAARGPPSPTCLPVHTLPSDSLPSVTRM